MPFFTYPAPADWLLPIIAIPLEFASLIFSFLHMIGLWGSIGLVCAVFAIFALDVMKPSKA